LREVADVEVPANNVRGSLSDLCVEQARVSQESIAGVLGVSQSTVSREMCRNRGQRGYRFRKLTAPLRRKIEAKLRQMRWSPEQISGWLFEQGHQVEP
jgi:IS30 family transposase